MRTMGTTILFIGLIMFAFGLAIRLSKKPEEVSEGNQWQKMYTSCLTRWTDEQNAHLETIRFKNKVIEDLYREALKNTKTPEQVTELSKIVNREKK